MSAIPSIISRSRPVSNSRVLRLASLRPNVSVWMLAGAGLLLSSGCETAPPASSQTVKTQNVVAQREGRYLTAAEVRAKQEREIERGIEFPKLVRGNPSMKTIALTFDDGPHPGFTEELLDILKEKQVRATFFVVGKMVDKHPELAQREAAEGHEVANHTYDHLRLATLQPPEIKSELVEGAQAIRRALGVSPKLYRPPGGEYDNDVIAATKRLGLTMVLWTDDPGDYASPGQSVIESYVEKKIANGGIILLHDGVQQTLDVLPGLIDAIKKRGFEFVTCAEMARQPGVIKAGGPKVVPRPSGQPNLKGQPVGPPPVRAST